MESQRSLMNKGTPKWLRVNSTCGSKEIKLSVVVGFLRFISYTWFCLIVFVGMALTYGITAKDNKTFYKLIESVFGSVNICAYFDFPPSTYILPTMYAIQIILVYQYALASIIRAWIAKLDNKISSLGFLLYSASFFYCCFSAAFFSTIFAVQPNTDDPNTIIVHTVPFTNFIISLTLLQIAVTWFGRNVSWKGLRHRSELTKRWWNSFHYVCLIGLFITSVFKIVHQINALGDLWTLNIETHTTHQTNHTQALDSETTLANGIWFNVHEYKLLLQIMDKIWLVTALIFPMIQSGYFTFKGFDAHLIIFNIRDNRRANPSDSSAENDVDQHELRPVSDTSIVS